MVGTREEKVKVSTQGDERKREENVQLGMCDGRERAEGGYKQ